MAKSSVTDRGELGVSATVKTKKRKDSDFYLCGVNIEPAENGIIVGCSYRLKPDVKKNDAKNDCYPGSYMPDEKNVFENYDGVIDFLTKKLAVMKSDEASEKKEG